MQQKNLYGTIGLLSGILLTILFTTSIVNSNNTGMMRMMGINTLGNNYQNGYRMVGNIDRHFIEQMIPHHEGAIMMAQLAQEKAMRTEIKTLANNIITSQSEEIAKMKNWYRDWYDKDVPEDLNVGMGMGRGMMRGGMMGDQLDTDALAKSEDFDKAFIEEMIPHHQMAVMMATMLENSTQKTEMKKLAADIVTAQTKEINQMRQWYREWGY